MKFDSSMWQNKIRNPSCTSCPLHKNAQHVCLMGSGPKKAKLMIVGEAPGAREDDENRAFVGPAGQLLDELLEEVGLHREDVYITNAVKCRPPNNETPTRVHIKACSQYLVQELEEVEPEYVLALGNSALQALTGRSGITKYRGRLHNLGGAQVLPTFHPAAALRSPKYLPAIKADFRALARYLGNSHLGDNGVPTRVRIIRNAGQFRWLLNRLATAEVIAFDLETTGLNEFAEGAQIVTFGVAWEPGLAAVVPLHHDAGTFAETASILSRLKPVMERTDCRYVGHNAKFDTRWLGHFGIYPPVSFDTMLASHLLDENGQHGLKPLSQLHLGALDYDIGDDVKSAYDVPLRRLAIYNGKDCDYTLRLYLHLREELKREPRVARLFTKLTMPASRALLRVEAAGMYVDRDRLVDRAHETEYKITKCINYMDQYVPDDMKPINYNSPAQVGLWLFGSMGLPILERTKGGAPSTREAVLFQLAKQHKAVEVLLRYRKWSKYYSTYITAWAEAIDPRGRLHTSYLLHGTVTGRLSSRGPNLQQVPRDTFIRSIIGAPPGWKFIEADYSQIELRIAAMVAQEKSMLRLFAMGEDIHMSTACFMTGKIPEQVTSEERKKAKAVNFGFLYGMGAQKFVIYARDSYDVEVTLAEAEKVRDRFFERYPRLRSWHDRQRRLATRYSRVQSPIGRIRHLPDVRSTDSDVRAESERQAINSPVQSFASDLMLVSLTRLDRSFPNNVARVVGSVHDALLFEVREQHVDEVCAKIKEVMEDTEYVRQVFGTEVTVPIEVEIKVGNHWGEGTPIG